MHRGRENEGPRSSRKLAQRKIIARTPPISTKLTDKNRYYIAGFILRSKIVWLVVEKYNLHIQFFVGFETFFPIPTPKKCPIISGRSYNSFNTFNICRVNPTSDW